MNAACHTDMCSDTKKFYHFLLQQCEMLGVKIIVKSTAKAVTINDDSITAIQVQTPEYELSLACKNLVIAAGAWSQNVIEVLFPQASYQSITTAKRQYMGINISNFQPGSSSGSGSDVYMELSKDTCPPNKHSSTPAANLPCEAIVEDLNELATTIMNVTTEKDTHLLKAGMAYIYESSSRRPVISRIPLVQLTSGSGEGTIDDLEQHQFHAGDALEFRIKRAWRSWTSSWFCSKILSDEKRFSTPACRDVQASHGMQGGVYLNTGHGMRGISLSLASGKLMSEIINNAQTSIPASKLGYNPWP